jgi:FkbM family methyltransferase
MNAKLILVLREATVKVKSIPGSVLVLDLIRRYFFTKALSLRVDNFDDSLTMDLRLNEHMQSQIFWYGSYSRDVLLIIKKLLRPGMVVVDAGANVGEITLAAAKAVGPSGRVYAFEPLPDVADLLYENVRLNAMNQVSVERRGLSDQGGRREIYRASFNFHDGSKHDGLATLYRSQTRDAASGEISLTTLDEFCECTNIGQLHLIKLDVEGAELPALKGGIRTLRRFKPHIVVEVQEETAHQAGYKAADVLSFLEALGYRFDVIGRKGRLRPVGPRSLGRFQNILCSPTNAC